MLYFYHFKYRILFRYYTDTSCQNWVSYWYRPYYCDLNNRYRVCGTYVIIKLYHYHTKQDNNNNKFLLLLLLYKGGMGIRL